MVFHPIRLALVAVVCMALGIAGADAKPPGGAAPADRSGALAACLETAAGLPSKVQDCAVRAQARKP